MPISKKKKGLVEAANPTTWNRKWVFGKDKLEHLGAGGVGVAILYYLGIPIWLAVVLSIGFFYGKEVLDGMGNGYPDVWDFACSALGALLVGSLIAIYVYNDGRENGGKKKSD